LKLLRLDFTELDEGGLLRVFADVGQRFCDEYLCSVCLKIGLMTSQKHFFRIFKNRRALLPRSSVLTVRFNINCIVLDECKDTIPISDIRR
jgi:hypothetical protein